MSSAPEILYRCPVCKTPGFTAGGLHRHQCHAKPERAKLTLVEISEAKPVDIRKGGAK